MSRESTRETAARIDREIVQEKATALGRAGERLQDALDAAVAVAARLRAETDPERRDALARDYDAARQRANTARLWLVIQREAVGLRHHRVVDQQFPEPPRVP